MLALPWSKCWPLYLLKQCLPLLCARREWGDPRPLPWPCPHKETVPLVFLSAKFECPQSALYHYLWKLPPKASVCILYFSAKLARSWSASGIHCPPSSPRAAGSLSVHAAFLLCNRALRRCSVFEECVLFACEINQEYFSRGMLWFQSRHETQKVQGRLGSFIHLLPGIDLGMWHDTAFAVLSATAIYTLLFRVILSPLGVSVLDKIFLLKFIKFAQVPRPIGVFWLCGNSGSKQGWMWGNFFFKMYQDSVP